jgi:hypothetical protein
VAAVDPHDSGLHESDSGLAFTLRYAVPGLIGTTVLAIGALGVGWLPLDGLRDVPLIHTMQTSDFGTLVSRASVILGGALILQAWLVVGGDVLVGHIRDVRRLWGVLALWILPLLLMPPLFSRDSYSYYAQGKLLLNGVDPYTNGVSSIPGWFDDGVDPMWSATPTPYGPLFLALSRGVAALVGDNPYFAVVAFRLIALVGVALLAVYVPRLAFHHGIDGSKALWLAVMNPLVLMHFVAGAHNDALMVGLIVAGLTVAIERGGVSGTLLIALAGMVKPIALLALPFVGLIWAGRESSTRTRFVAWLKVGAITVGSFVVLSAVVGVSAGWIRALTTPGEVRTWLSPPTALGMFAGNLLGWIGLGEHTDLTVAVVRIACMLAAVAIVATLILRPEGRTPVRGAALAFVAVVLLGPVVQPWYLLWALPLAAASGLRPRSLRWVVAGIAAFTLYGMWETSATSDTFFELSDWVAIAAATAAVAFAVTVSPRERALIFGDAVHHGLVPDDAPAQARHDRLVVRARAGA